MYLMVALEESEKGSPRLKLVEFVIWAPWISVPNFMAVHQTVVISDWPKMVDRPTA